MERKDRVGVRLFYKHFYVMIFFNVQQLPKNVHILILGACSAAKRTLLLSSSHGP